MDELRNDEMQDEELERYGVWVKAGPEEVVEADEDYSLSDLSEDLDDTLDDTGDQPPAESIDQADSTGDAEDLPSLDEFDDISLDDLDFGEGDDIDTAESPEPLAEDQMPALGDSADELMIDTPTDTESDSSHADEEDLISLDDFDLDVPDEDPDPFQGLADDTESDSGNAEDFNLDELEEELPDDFEELDIDDSDSVDTTTPLESDEFDSSIPGSDGELDDLSVDDISVEDSSEELPELEVDSLEESEHDFTPEDQGIEIESLQPSNTISPDEEKFLSDESDLQNESESAIPTAMDLQEREAFERIQTELTDIKRELAELKAALRGAGTSAPEEAPPPEKPTPATGTGPEEFSEETPADDTGQMGPGFFEEEEDETIALTGDELDNILNTAEFTEQAGEAVELEDDFIVEPEPAVQGENEEVDDFDLELDEATDDLEADDESGELDLGEEVDFDPDHEAYESDASDDEVASIELEPVERNSVIIEGDDSAVDELAEMDIDSELADIDSLEDETEDASDDLEIDIDDLEDVDTSGVLEESADTAAEESAAEMDRQALQADTEDLNDELDDLDELDIDDLDLDDSSDQEVLEPVPEPIEDTQAEDLEAEDLEAEDADFDQFAAAVEDDIASGETGVQLDEQFDEEPVPETAPEEVDLENDDDGEIEIDLDDIDGLDEFEEAGPPDVPVPEPSEPEESSQDQEQDQEDQSTPQSAASISDLPDDLKQEIRSVLSYMDQLLEALPDDKIEEFAHSEHFDVYKRLFEELGLET